MLKLSIDIWIGILSDFLFKENNSIALFNFAICKNDKFRQEVYPRVRISWFCEATPVLLFDRLGFKIVKCIFDRRINLSNVEALIVCERENTYEHLSVCRNLKMLSVRNFEHINPCIFPKLEKLRIVVDYKHCELIALSKVSKLTWLEINNIRYEFRNNVEELLLSFVTHSKFTTLILDLYTGIYLKSLKIIVEHCTTLERFETLIKDVSAEEVEPYTLLLLQRNKGMRTMYVNSVRYNDNELHLSRVTDIKNIALACSFISRLVLHYCDVTIVYINEVLSSLPFLNYLYIATCHTMECDIKINLCNIETLGFNMNEYYGVIFSRDNKVKKVHIEQELSDRKMEALTYIFPNVKTICSFFDYPQLRNIEGVEFING